MSFQFYFIFCFIRKREEEKEAKELKSEKRCSFSSVGKPAECPLCH